MKKEGIRHSFKKKLIISLVVLVSILTLSSCSNFSNTKKSEQYKLNLHDQALNIFDNYIKLKPEDSKISKEDVIQIITLEKISDTYFLISYKTAPILPITNYNYALVDIKNDICKLINLDTDDYISEVSFNSESISFYCDGRNTFNGFKDFPHNFNYNIEDGIITKEYIFHPLKGSSAILGSGSNKIVLKSITEENKTILFDFSEVAGEILAGGAFSPSIKIGSRDDPEVENAFFVDFENTILLRDAEEQLNKIQESEYVKKISTRNYTGMYGENHLTLYFEFENVTEYSGKFESDERGFMDFSLILR